MTEEEYLIGIGKIVGNLHALELAMRVFLSDAHGENPTLPTHKDLNTKVPVTYLTNHDSLGDLIGKFNAGLTSQEQQFIVDRSLIDIRDAIAHGRVTTLTGFPLEMFKCGRPSGGMVEIVFVQTLDMAWIKQSTKRILDAFMGVAACSRARAYKSIQ